MSQSQFLQEEYSKKICQTVNNAAINVAIADLVAAQKARHTDGSKRLSKSSQSYQHVIASLQLVGVKITYNALMKRVSRASLGDIAMAEITLQTHPNNQLRPLYRLTSKPMIHRMIHSPLSLRTRTKPNTNLVLEAIPKEAQTPRRSKTYLTHLNALMPLFLNTPGNTMLLNLLVERWNMGTWKG